MLMSKEVPQLVPVRLSARLLFQPPQELAAMARHLHEQAGCPQFHGRVRPINLHVHGVPVDPVSEQLTLGKTAEQRRTRLEAVTSMVEGRSATPRIAQRLANLHLDALFGEGEGRGEATESGADDDCVEEA